MLAFVDDKAPLTAVSVQKTSFANAERAKPMTEALFSDPEALARLCRRYRIKSLSLFGSTRSGRASPASDVDLLVEFEPDASQAC